MGFTFVVDLVGRWHNDIFKLHRISGTQVIGWGKKTDPREENALVQL